VVVGNFRLGRTDGVIHLNWLGEHAPYPLDFTALFQALFARSFCEKSALAQGWTNSLKTFPTFGYTSGDARCAPLQLYYEFMITPDARLGLTLR
jgi:hypothetical protein